MSIENDIPFTDRNGKKFVLVRINISSLLDLAPFEMESRIFFIRWLWKLANIIRQKTGKPVKEKYRELGNCATLLKDEEACRKIVYSKQFSVPAWIEAEGIKVDNRHYWDYMDLENLQPKSREHIYYSTAKESFQSLLESLGINPQWANHYFLLQIVK